MQISPQVQVIIDSLQDKRDEAYLRVKDYDKIIKQLKAGDYSFLTVNGHAPSVEVKPANIESNIKANDEFPINSSTKVQILTIMDRIRKACKLRDIQDEFKKLTGTSPNLRESVRTLNKAGKVLMMREKGAKRGSYWVKSEWVDDGLLLPEYKFEGFNLLYDDTELEFTRRGL